MLESLVLAATIAAAASPDATSAIKSMNDSYVAAMIAGDAHTVASHFEPNAMMASKNTAVRGRDNIEAYIKAALAKGRPASGTCTTSHIDVEGAKAFETGACTFNFPTANGTFHYGYHYLAVWHEQSDGSWLLSTDVSE